MPPLNMNLFDSRFSWRLRESRRSSHKPLTEKETQNVKILSVTQGMHRQSEVSPHTAGQLWQRVSPLLQSWVQR